MRTVRSLAATVSVAALLAGCSLAPKYERPQAPVQGAYPTGPAYTQVAATAPDANAANIGWREFFTDPKLQDLIGRALANNRDLRVAALNVEATRAQYQIQRAGELPTLNGQANGSVQRLPHDLSQTGRPHVSRQYTVGLGVTSFELDLWGRVRSLSDQALETFFAQEETRTSTQLSLVAEVANAYLTLLADQDLLALTQETLESQRQSYGLTQQSYTGGVATELDLRQAETSVRQAEANLAQYTRQVAQDRNALTLLVGEPLPDDYAAGSGRGLVGEGMLAALPAGLPSDLLERRPDIRSAEHSLQAANANIGAARAAFFPTISLTGTLGTASRNLTGLFGNGSENWSFAPQVSVPIFDFGRNQANLDLAKVRTNIQVATYEKAIQTAFREVADGLAARGTLDDQLRAQDALTQASAASYQLSDMRYRSGVDSYLNTLVAQRNLYSAQQTLITTRLNRLTNLVTLYKALGGGWTERTAQAQSATTP